MPYMDPYDWPAASSNSGSDTLVCAAPVCYGERSDRGSSFKLALPRWSTFTQCLTVVEDP